MDYVKYAMEEAKRLAAQEESPKHHIYSDMVRYLHQKRERYYRRLHTYLSEFVGLNLKSGRTLLLSNLGSSVHPCIRMVEKVEFPMSEMVEGASQDHTLVDIFVEITEDGLESRVQCRAECLWLEHALRLTSSDPENLMKPLARQLGELLKVEEVFGSDE